MGTRAGIVAGLVLILGSACATNDYLRLASKSIEAEEFDSAVRYLEKGASEGDERCDYFLATLMLSGELGGERDPETGSRWLRNAANAGLPDAQSDLGELYERGDGVERNPARAAEWYRKAADAGLPVAQAHLGLLYAAGLGLEEDPVLAAQWFRKAAVAGDPLGQGALGAATFQGVGVPKDVIEAYMWTRLAANQGNAKAVKNLPAIAREMTDEELRKARHKVSRFRAKGARRDHARPRPRHQSSDSLSQIHGSGRTPR